MSLLTQWITQIVIFLLLATIIDLLVPANSMKKYVKFVIGLILILIFIQPIFNIFNINIKQALKTSINEYITDYGDTKNMENLIELQKSEIESTQNAYILEQMAVQLKDLAKDPLAADFEAEITGMDFKFIPESDYTYENLEEVIVILGDSKTEEGVVNAVNDVVINTEEPVEIVEEDKQLADIKSLLQEVWGLNEKNLTIKWEGGTS